MDYFLKSVVKCLAELVQPPIRVVIDFFLQSIEPKVIWPESTSIYEGQWFVVSLNILPVCTIVTMLVYKQNLVEKLQIFRHLNNYYISENEYTKKKRRNIHNAVTSGQLWEWKFLSLWAIKDHTKSIEILP